MDKIKIRLAIKALRLVADAIREVGEIPSGTLYAVLMANGCTLQTYESIISTLKKAGLISESNNMLKWMLHQ